MNVKSLLTLAALIGMILLGGWYYGNYMCCCNKAALETKTKLPYYFTGKDDKLIKTSASFTTYLDSLGKVYKIGDTINVIGHYYYGEDSIVGIARAKALQENLATRFGNASFKTTLVQIATDVPSPDDYLGAIPKFIPGPIPGNIATSVIAADGSLILYFPTGSTVEKFDASTETNLKNVIEASKQAGKTIMVSGHTDNKGNPDKNMILSKNRAEKVKSILLKRGAMESIIKTQGFGQTQPIDPADNETARSKNRRVEVKVQ